MGSKLVSKDALSYKNGYIVNGQEDIVVFEGSIPAQLMYLDEKIQEMQFSKEKRNAMKDLGNIVDMKFEKKSEYSNTVIEKPETKNLEKAVKKSLDIMEDITKISEYEKISELVSQYKNVFDMFDEDYIAVCDAQGFVKKLDLPIIGNPLKVTSKEIIDIIKSAI